MSLRVPVFEGGVLPRTRGQPWLSHRQAKRPRVQALYSIPFHSPPLARIGTISLYSRRLCRQGYCYIVKFLPFSDRNLVPNLLKRTLVNILGFGGLSTSGREENGSLIFTVMKGCNKIRLKSDDKKKNLQTAFGRGRLDQP